MAAVGWREKIERQLEVVQQWRQSGKSIAAWAQAHGVDAKLLMGWVTYERRWRQRLGQTRPHLTNAAVNAADSAAADSAAPHAAGATAGAAKPKQLTKGFVAVRSDPVGPVQAVSRAVADAAANPAPRCAVAQINPNPVGVRIECAIAGSGAVNLVLHWPVDHGHELAAWLKSMAAA